MARFDPDDAGIKQLGNEPGIAAHEKTIGEQVLALAAANSPSDAFSGSLEILAITEGPDGVTVSAGSRWSFAHLIEWGSVNNAPYAPLRKAISTMGLRFEED